MPRIARFVVPNYPHHITQRGNYRQDVFKGDKDKRQYLEFIAFYSKKFNLTILSYCLMDNHVHLIVIPRNERSIARTLSISHTRYAQYFNKKLRASGHLWQGRFYSCILDEKHLVACARYVERNPVRAGMVKRPEEYAWSSAKEHADASISNKHILDTGRLFEYIDIGKGRWKDVLSESDDPEEVSLIRKHTMTGRPLGGNAFIDKLEDKLNMRLRALPVGRPKKIVKKKVSVPN